MKKLLKLVFILVIMTAFSINSPVMATTEGTTTSNAFITMATVNSSDASSTPVSTDSSTSEKELQISDILNILLIATGIVIIILAIAIFIKLK